MNDGICDYELCCDGSDEWQGVGGVKCEDKCKEIGKEWKKQNEIRQKAHTAATKKRKELLTEAGRLRKEVEDRIQTLKVEVTSSEIKVTALKKELADIERKEKGKIIKSAAAGTKGGKLAVLSSLAKNRIDELRENLGSVREQRDASKARVKELEEILTAFKEEYNPNFNDEGVKRAVKRWEDYAARDKSEEEAGAIERDLDEMLKSDADNGLDWAEFEEEEESDVDVREFPSDPIIYMLKPVSNPPSQSTNLKNTSPSPFVTGSTTSCAISASFSSRTASSPVSLRTARNPRPSRKPSSVSPPPRTRSAIRTTSSPSTRRTSPRNTDRRRSSARSRAAASRRIAASTRTSSAGWNARRRNPRRAGVTRGWATLCASRRSSWTRTCRLMGRGWAAVRGTR